jgi:hypothetical protein
MADRIQVFISSTAEFAAQRQQIADKLPRRIKVYLYEKDRPRRQTAREWCQIQINKSKVFVGILGSKWGTPYPNEDGSIVEWEFDTARARQDIEIMVFIRKPEASDIDPNQKIFIDKLERFDTGVWRSPFDTAPTMITDVVNSVSDWYVEFLEEEMTRRDEILSHLHNYLRPIVIAALLLGALSLVFALMHTSPIFLQIISGISILLLAGCFLLFLSQTGG